MAVASASFSGPATPLTEDPNAVTPDVILSGGVRKAVLITGDNSSELTRVAPFAKLTIAYTLFLGNPLRADGSVSPLDDIEADPSTFDVFSKGEIMEERKGIEVVVGDGNYISPVLPALEVGLLSMCKGEKSDIVVINRVGSDGFDLSENIGGNTQILIYHVTVKDIIHEVDISPQRNRMSVKYINKQGTPVTDPSIPPIQYESECDIKLMEWDEVRDRVRNPQSLKVVVGHTHEAWLDTALVSMVPGEFSEFFVRTDTNRVPKRFSVHLVSYTSTNPALWLDERAVAEAKKRKDIGNEFFKQKLHVKALNAYQHGRSIIGEGHYSSQEAFERIASAVRELDATLCANSAQAALNANQPELSVSFASLAISHNPNQVKNYFRRAKAYRMLDKFVDARSDLQKCQEIIATYPDTSGANVAEIEAEMHEISALEFAAASSAGSSVAAALSALL